MPQLNHETVRGMLRFSPAQLERAPHTLYHLDSQYMHATIQHHGFNAHLNRLK